MLRRFGEFLREVRAEWVADDALSLGALSLGAAGVFGQLQHSLNKIWEAPPPQRGGLRSQVRKRVLAFGMILGIGFLLLVSLAVSAALALVHDLLAAHVPLLIAVLPTINLLLGFAVITT